MCSMRSTPAISSRQSSHLPTGLTRNRARHEVCSSSLIVVRVVREAQRFGFFRRVGDQAPGLVVRRDSSDEGSSTHGHCFTGCLYTVTSR